MESRRLTRTQSHLVWRSPFPRRPYPRPPFRPIRMAPRPTPFADWHCEGWAVGVLHEGVCSPGNPIHSPPCGWMS